MGNEINRLSLAQLGNLEFLAKQVVEGFITGLHKSPFHGFSVEFSEHRLYNTGESTKHIDWKLFAKSGKYFTKKYEEETNLRCQIVIDSSSSMYFPKDNGLNKLDFSIYAAASLIELLKKQRDAVGLSFFSEKVELHTQAKSSIAHHRYLYSELEKRMHSYEEKGKSNTNIIDSLHAISEMTHQRSLVIIFSDLLDNPEQTDAFFQALQHLKHNKHEVIVFHVVNKTLEVDFELENRPHTLIDMETGVKMKLQPNEIKLLYKKSIQKYFADLKLKCANNKIDFIPAYTEDGYEQLLLKYLIKRGKMR
jgi:uncharacterized protein (DUF58 family)